jgi:NADH:quinone reductase (non-electrogenic)
MNDPSLQETNVVVVGGGFAGVACAKELAQNGVHVTLVDRHNYTQFQPMLYQVATAQIAPLGVARPLRGVFRRKRNVDVKMATITHVDPATRTVTCDDGTSYTGDYLVLAMGSKPNFFGTPGAEEHAFPLYSVADAERLRSRLFAVFEHADRSPELLQQGALNFVIVGAGATGVETAGALADLVNHVLPTRFHDIGLDDANVYLVDPAPKVLAPFSERAHDYAAGVLERKGVQLLLNTKVTRIEPDRVVLSDGREILTRSVVWAGGIAAADLAAQSGVTPGRGGRIDVNPDLTVGDYSRVYALGDVANTLGPDGKAFPQLGSVALQAGRCAAKNIVADRSGQERTPFRYRDKGIMAMIGRNAAIAEMGPRRIEVHGMPAFASWLGVHAYLLSGTRARGEAVRSWLWDYATKARPASIIDRPDASRIDWAERTVDLTGEPASPATATEEGTRWQSTTTS